MNFTLILSVAGATLCSALTTGASKSSKPKEEAVGANYYCRRRLGDPTDPETGWDVCFKRVKTGPLPYNVEYQLQALKCKPRALSDDEVAAVEGLKSMDEVMPRPTPDAQKELLDRLRDP